MKLTDFHAAIPKPVLSKGIALVHDGRVLEVTEEGEGVWRAEVQGPEIFVVRVETVERGELFCMCTCPNDEDDACEHVAAALLTLEALMLEGAIGKPKKKAKGPAKKKETKPAKLRRLLGRMPPEAVLDVVLQLAEEDSNVLNRLLLLVDDGVANPADYRRVIKEAFRAGRGSTGYVNTSGAKRVAKIVESLLDQAEEALRNGRAKTGTTIVQVVIDEINAAIGQVDDKNAHLETPFGRATELLASISRTVKDQERRDLLEYLLVKAADAGVMLLGNGWDLLAIAVDMVQTAQERSLVDGVLGAMEKELARQRYWDLSYAFVQDRCIALRLILVKRFDGEKAVREFMLAHRQSETIRRQLIQIYIEENEPAKALQLVEEAIQKLNKSGMEALSHEYRMQRIALLETLGDTAQLGRALQEEWIITRRKEDYLRLRKTVSERDWPPLRKKLATSLKRDLQLAAWMWAQDGVWAEVLKIAQADLRPVVAFRPELEQRFPDKMADLYQRRIALLLNNSYTYWDSEVVVFIQAMKNMGLEQRVQTLVEEITRNHPKRVHLLKALREL